VSEFVFYVTGYAIIRGDPAHLIRLDVLESLSAVDAISMHSREFAVYSFADVCPLANILPVSRSRRVLFVHHCQWSIW